MRVHLAGTGLPEPESSISGFRRLAASATNPRHEIVDSPDIADAILFTECHLHNDDWSLRILRDHPLRRQYPTKCYVYNERDSPWAIMSGLYVSYPERLIHEQWMRPVPYYFIPDRFAERLAQAERTLLFSFVGSPTHRSRQAIFSLVHPRALVSRSDGYVFYESTSTDFVKKSELFVTAALTSKFVLCPRGVGLSSIRLFEAMAAGAVPVVIADGWAPPHGPDWGSFAVFWPEAEIADLPAYLEEREHDAEHMGLLARSAYEEWIAPPVAFNRLMDQLAELVEGSAAETFPAHGLRDRRMLAVIVGTGRVWQGRQRRRAAVFARRVKTAMQPRSWHPR